MDLKTIEHEALSLSPEDRAKLAQKLILSLDLLSTHGSLIFSKGSRKSMTYTA